MLPVSITSDDRFVCVSLSNKQPLKTDAKTPANANGVWSLYTYDDVRTAIDADANAHPTAPRLARAYGYLPSTQYIVLDFDEHVDGWDINDFAKITYTEHSLSKNRHYHVIFKNNLKRLKNKIIVKLDNGGQFEVFGGKNAANYIALTGDIVDNGTMDIVDIPEPYYTIIQNAIDGINKQKNKNTVFVHSDKKINVENYEKNLNEQLIEKLSKKYDAITELTNILGFNPEKTEKQANENGLYGQSVTLGHHISITLGNIPTWFCWFDNHGGSLFEAIAAKLNVFNTGKITDYSKVFNYINKIYNIDFTPDDINSYCGYTASSISKNIKENDSIDKKKNPTLIEGKIIKVQKKGNISLDVIKSRLPKFIRDYIDTVARETNAYEEYSLMNMLYGISCACDGNIRISTPFLKNFRAKINAICIGETTISRKSTALKIFDNQVWQKVLEHFDPYHLELKSDNTPLTGSRMPDFISSSAFLQEFDERDCLDYINDEISTLFKLCGQTYASDLPQLLIKTYDGTHIERKYADKPKLKNNEEPTKTIYQCAEPCLNMIGCTTPTEYATMLNGNMQHYTSGFLPRVMVVYPEHPLKETDMDAAWDALDTGTDNIVSYTPWINGLIGIAKWAKSQLNMRKNTLYIEKDARLIYNRMVTETDKKIMMQKTKAKRTNQNNKITDEMIAAIQSRNQSIMAIIAGFFAIANKIEEIPTGQIINGNFGDISIKKDDMQLAYDYINMYIIPDTIKAMKMAASPMGWGQTERARKYQGYQDYIEEKEIVEIHTMLRECAPIAHGYEADDIIKSLIDSQVMIPIDIRYKNKIHHAYKYIPPYINREDYDEHYDYKWDTSPPTKKLLGN